MFWGNLGARNPAILFGCNWICCDFLVNWFCFVGFLVALDEGGVCRGGDGSDVVGGKDGPCGGDEPKEGCPLQDEIRYDGC